MANKPIPRYGEFEGVYISEEGQKLLNEKVSDTGKLLLFLACKGTYASSNQFGTTPSALARQLNVTCWTIVKYFDQFEALGLIRMVEETGAYMINPYIATKETDDYLEAQIDFWDKVPESPKLDKIQYLEPFEDEPDELWPLGCSFLEWLRQKKHNKQNRKNKFFEYFVWKAERKDLFGKN